MSSAVLSLITLTLLTVVSSNFTAATAASSGVGDGIDDRNSTTGVAGSSTWIPSSDEAATTTAEGNLTDVSSTTSASVDTATWTGKIKLITASEISD